jgi:hypothetical protein
MWKHSSSFPMNEPVKAKERARSGQKIQIELVE